MNQTDPTRIPIGRNVTYAVRGTPEVPDEYNAERTIAPTEISLTYRASEDSQLGRIHAYVKGWWMEGGARVPMDKPVGRHFYGDLGAWPEWLAAEARLHDPDAAVSVVVSPPPNRAALRTSAAEALREHWDVHANDPDLADDFGCCADAVLSVLPEPGRAAEVILKRVREYLETRLDQVAVDPAEVYNLLADAPLSPDYQHPDCGFNWHGRDDMDIPMRDGQPVCPRCELLAVEKRLHYTQRRREEVGTESLRRGKIKADQAERIRVLEREIDGIREQLGKEMLRADAAESELRRLAAEAPQRESGVPTVLDLADGPVRCPLCPYPVTLRTPAGARAHFTAVHPEQRITGRGLGPWPQLVTDGAEAPQPDTETRRRETVEYFLQCQQPDGTWEDASSFMDALDWATARLAAKRGRFPEFEFRIAQRTTTVVVQPLTDGEQPASAVSQPAAADTEETRRG